MGFRSSTVREGALLSGHAPVYCNAPTAGECVCERTAGSGRPRSSRIADNIATVEHSLGEVINFITFLYSIHPCLH